MAEDLPNQPKNRTFLAQFLNEGIYLIPGEEISVVEEAREQSPEEPPEVIESQAEQGTEEATAEAPTLQQPEAPVQGNPTDEASNQEIADPSIPSDETANNETPQQGAEASSVKNNDLQKQDEEETPVVTESQSNPAGGETSGSEESTVEEPDDQQTETPPQNQETAEGSLTTESPALPYEGQNQKGILILVNHQSEKNLLPKEQLILGRILKAVGLSMDDVAVVNLEKTGAAIEQITEVLTTEQILAFGLDTTELPIPAQPMKPEEWNGLPLLAAPSLEEIAMNKQNKKQLWHNLKTMFDI